MRRPKHNVLLIVEGAKDEPRLVDSLFKAFAHDEEWLIHLYGTVIHDLVAKINSDYDGDYDNIEIRKVLVEMLPDDQQAKRDRLLYTKFTDVILMFDFDPQDDRMDIDGLRKMQSSFNDSSDTDKGLLLINYPAIESVKEAAALPYEVYLETFTQMSDIDSYKQIVNQTISGYSGSYGNFATYGAGLFAKAIANTVGKVQHMLDGLGIEETFPFTHAGSLSDCCWNISLTDLLDFQIREYTKNGRVASCGTGPFFIAGWKRSLDGAWKAYYGD